MHIMIDLETMGTKPGCAIVAIGAVKFDNDKLVDGFYSKIQLKSCLDLGLKIDASTIQWWLRQSDATRGEINVEGIGDTLPVALQKLNEWIANKHTNDVYAWGNGADFDLPILEACYNVLPVEIPVPWGNFNGRCYRTVKNMFKNIRIEKVGEKHNAVNDATAQAMHLINILKLNGLPLA